MPLIYEIFVKPLIINEQIKIAFADYEPVLDFVGLDKLESTQVIISNISNGQAGISCDMEILKILELSKFLF